MFFCQTDHIRISIKAVLLTLLSAVIYARYIVADGNVAKQLSTLKKRAIIMTGSVLGIFVVNVNKLLSNTTIDFGLFKWASNSTAVTFCGRDSKDQCRTELIDHDVELPVAILFAHIFLDEHLDPSQWVGTTIMLLPLILLNTLKAGWLKWDVINVKIIFGRKM